MPGQICSDECPEWVAKAVAWWITALDTDSAYGPPASKIVPRPASPAREERSLGHFEYGFIDTAQLTFAPDGSGRTVGTAGRQGCQCTIRAFSLGLPADRQGGCGRRGARTSDRGGAS